MCVCVNVVQCCLVCTNIVVLMLKIFLCVKQEKLKPLWEELVVLGGFKSPFCTGSRTRGEEKFL